MGRSVRGKTLQRKALRSFLMCVVIALPGSGSAALGQELPADRMAHRLIQVWKNLGSLPSGHELVEKAQKTWNLKAEVDFLKHLKLGASSRTDTVLTRHFSVQTGQEERERAVTIFLRENQSDTELLLDLAHELVHATSRPVFDPYDPQLSPVQYIQTAIDGAGGEVDAVLAECSVAGEVADRGGRIARRCRNYLESSVVSSQGRRSLIRGRIAQDFYRVGTWLTEIQKDLGSETRLLPLLKSEAPRLYSSSVHAPYPVALFQEYQDMTQAVCQNSLERKRSLELSRAVEQVTQMPVIEKLLATRCRGGISVAKQE